MTTNGQRRGLLALVIAVSIALLWVIRPYLGAVFWGAILAIVLAPVNAWLLRVSGRRKTFAASATLLAFVLGVGVPLALLVAALVRQARGLYADIATGKVDFGRYVQQIADAMPQWAHEGLDWLGLGDFDAVQEKFSASAVEASRFVASHLLGIGINAFSFALSLAIMLYLLFVLLRDGKPLARRVERSLPLSAGNTQALVATFTTVIRATVKGGVVMAATQGVLGGVVLGMLGIDGPLFWGVIFAILSMVPAVGAGLLWAPIALYFLVTGAVWKGLLLIFFGAVVLTVVDNVLRPILVGRDTHLPGYLVLVATLGGIATLGLNGIIIGPTIAAIFVASWDLLQPEGIRAESP